MPRIVEPETSCVLGNLAEQALELARCGAQALAHGPMFGGKRGHLRAQTRIFLTQLFHGSCKRHGFVGQCLKIIEHGRDVNKHTPHRIIER